jgi:hypothetical protein
MNRDVEIVMDLNTLKNQASYIGFQKVTGDCIVRAVTTVLMPYYPAGIFLIICSPSSCRDMMGQFGSVLFAT